MDTDHNLSYVDFNLLGDGFGTSTGYYRLIPREDASNNLCYIDYETHTQAMLCSRPECTHEDETCTSWIPYGAGGGSIFVTKKNLYYVSYGNQAALDSIGEDAIPSILQMDLNGANRKKVYTFTASDIIRAGIAYDENTLYLVYDSYEGAETGELPKRYLSAVDLTAGTLERLCEVAYLTQIVGVSGDDLVLSDISSLNSGNTPEAQTKVFTYHIESGQMNEIIAHPFSVSGRVGGNRYYLYDPDKGKLSFCELEPNAKTKTVKTDLFDAETLSCSKSIGALIDGHLFVIYESKIKDSYDVLRQLYAIDVSNGNVTAINRDIWRSDGKTQTRKLEVVAEWKDYFLVIVGYDTKPVKVPIGDGTFTADYAYFHYALVLKDDYYASRENDIIIPDIF